MNERKIYFLKQKLVGVLFIAVTALAVVLTKDATIAIFTVPIGLDLIFTKEMLLTNQYYYEVNNKEQSGEL